MEEETKSFEAKVREIAERVYEEKQATFGARIQKKYYLKDSADRDFRTNGYDVKLVAGEKKEVSEVIAKELKEQYPYLELTEEE